MENDRGPFLSNPFVARAARWGLLAWSVIGLLILLYILYRFVLYPIRVISPPLIVAIIVCLRLAILFPAIAIDAPGATASKALADTRGFAVDIFLIYLLAALPIVAIDFISRGLNLPMMIGTVVDGLLDVIALVLLVVITSRIFQALADRTLRPAPG